MSETKQKKVRDPSSPKNSIDKVRDFLSTRQQGYRETFNLESIFAKRVLEDLGKFCRAEESSFHPDPRLHAVLEGRREVWLRIQRHLKLEPNELFNHYTKGEADE